MSTRFKDPWLWSRGLLAAVIMGSASAGASWVGVVAAKASGLDVPSLNLKSLGIILASSGLFSLFGYLAKSPLPDLVVEETITTETTKTETTKNTTETKPI